MKNLINSLTANDSTLKTRRATLLAAGIEAAQVTLIQGLNSQKLQIETELQQLLDLAPVSTTQLTVGHDQFNPGGFVSAIQQKKFRLYEINVQLDLAKETLAEWSADVTPSQETAAE